MTLPELDVPVRLEPPVGLPVNLWINNKPLYSVRNSEKEFQRFLSTLQALPADARILLIGAGALFDRLHPFSITVYEPIPALRHMYASRTGLNLTGPDVDLQDFDAIIVQPAYRRMFPELQRFHKEYRENRQRPRPAVDDRTTAHFLRQWMRNYSLRLHHPALCFFQAFEPMPSTILFCGAGPSLLEDLRLYGQEFQRSGERPLILAADTAAAAVFAAGWSMDLIISIDSGFGTAYHLALLKALVSRQGQPLPPVLTWMAGSVFPERAGFPVYFVPTLFPPDQVLSAHLPLGTPYSNPFRNVLGYAVALQSRHPRARLLLAGVGLEPRQQQFYVRGTGYDSYHRSTQNRLYTTEHYHVLLTGRQSRANPSAMARLAEAKRLSEKRPGYVESGPFQLRSVQFTGKRLQTILARSQLPGLVGQEFGPQWQQMALRHLSFSD